MCRQGNRNAVLIISSLTTEQTKVITVAREWRRNDGARAYSAADPKYMMSNSGRRVGCILAVREQVTSIILWRNIRQR
jgi:hypothetical protein